jgi:serine/threonine-protein kinase
VNDSTQVTWSVDEARRRRFEAAWREDGPQPIEQFLPPPEEPAYLPTLAELVRIDLEFAWKAWGEGKAGQPTAVEEYLRRFPELAAPTYRSMLQSHEAELRRRSELPAEGANRPTAAAMTVELPDLPGYAILGRLGRGGMGVVYKARHLALNRIVAVKMLLDRVDEDPAAHERFRAEAEAAARLRHPNIVQIYEVGEHRGRPYFTLEYVAGGGLDRLINGAPQPHRPAAILAMELARAVHYAHRQGVIHRDLKPANVLIENTIADDALPSVATRAGAATLVGSASRSSTAVANDLIPKITDFGLAKRLDSPSQTKTGDVLGTPSYMAPEQARGDKEVGPGADVYSLGAILYECLTGRPPFRGVSGWATVEMVLSREAVPPREFAPAVPRDVETICLKCLAKEPAKRYATAEALAEDLEQFLNDRPILARPIGRVERARRWARRNPAVAGLSLALVVLAAGAFTALTALWLRADRLRVAAEASAADARRAQSRADANFRKARDVVDQLLARVSDEKLNGVPHLELVRRDIVEDALRYYREFLAERSDDPGVRLEAGRALRKMGELERHLGRYAEADAHARESLTLLEPLANEAPGSPEPAWELSLAHHDQGKLLSLLGRGEEAGLAYRRSVDLDRRLVAAHPDHPEYAGGLAAGLISWGLSTGRREISGPALVEADGILSRLVTGQSNDARRSNFPLNLGIAKLNLGGLAVTAGRPEEAERLYRDALQVHGRLAEEFPSSPVCSEQLAADLNALANLLAETGRLAEAEPTYRRAIALREKLVRDFPGVADYQTQAALTQIDLQFALRAAGRPLTAELIQSHRDAVTWNERLVAEFPALPGHRARLATALGSLARVERDLGRQREAETDLRRAVDLFTRLAAEQLAEPRYRSNLANDLAGLAELVTWTDRKKDAEEQFRRATELADALAAEYPDVPGYRHTASRAAYGWAVLLRNTGRPAKALELYDRSLALQQRLAEQVPADVHYRLDLATTHTSRGIALVETGRHAEAERGYRTAVEIYDRFLAATPGTSKYLSLKGAALDNMAESMLSRGEPAGAKAAVTEAVALELEALRGAPRNPEYLRFLASHYEVLGRADLGLGDQAAAAAAARDLADRFPGDGKQLRTAAGLLARCAASAELNPRLSPGEQKAAVTIYTGEAIVLMRRAVANGFRDAADLRGHPDLSRLRDTDAFRQILAEVERPPAK